MADLGKLDLLDYFVHLRLKPLEGGLRDIIDWQVEVECGARNASESNACTPL